MTHTAYLFIPPYTTFADAGTPLARENLAARLRAARAYLSLPAGARPAPAAFLVDDAGLDPLAGERASQ